MLQHLFAAFWLLACCVAVHAAGVTWALRWVTQHPETTRRFLRWTWLFTRVAAWMVLLHLVEIGVWAWYYVWAGAIPDAASALYFSAVTYTTTGYGDVVLPETFRLLAALEALTGILMCGWSTGFFFAVASRMSAMYVTRTE